MAPSVGEILKLISQGEGLHLEMKSCSNSLPNSVWETYSAFANTRGGVIVLGISEDKSISGEGRYTIIGVQDVNKIVTDFFNTINNAQKVSRNILIDSDVRIIRIDDKEIVYIKVNEADYRQKPIYINGNIQSGTYKRVHEGDRHVTEKELSLLIRDSQDDIDLQPIKNYGLEDIDIPTLRAYRQNFKDLNPDHPFTDLPDMEFLRKLGGFAKDRKYGFEALTMAGLLMFGKSQAIHEIFPNFRVDYLNLIGITPDSDKKWNDRLTDDGRWEDNLFNFLTITLQKLFLTLPNEGRLEGIVRKDGGILHQAIREGIVNSLAYCDYKLGGVLRIDRRTDKIIIRNPGTLRISPERIYEGDYTQARNATIQKMLRMIGLGDNIGSGFQKILMAWNMLAYRKPEIKEIDEVKEVWLSLPLIPRYINWENEREGDPKLYQSDQKGEPDQETREPDHKNFVSHQEKNLTDLTDLTDLTRDLTDLTRDLTEDLTKQVLNLIRRDPSMGYTRIAAILSQNETKIKKILRSLKNLNKIKRVGPSFGGKWIINES